MASGFRCVLDLDPDLADQLDAEVRRVARAAATALTLDVEPGHVRLSEWLGRVSGGPGLLLVDGVLALETRVGDRIAAELVGAGDLLQPHRREADELLECDVAWQALLQTRIVLLDEAFAKRVRFWPQITQTCLRRACRRTSHLNVQRAIAAQPRLELRLALLLWHLAGRWGKVEPGGIRLPLPLTHNLLGRLVGAERPSVSHALARLAHAGLVTGHGAEWHLHSRIRQQLPSMFDDGGESVETILAAVAPIRP